MAATLVLALAPAALSPAGATSVQKKTTARAQAFGFTGPLGAVTPAAADPHGAAVLARGGLDGGFRFTPAATKGSRRAVTVAVRANSVRGDTRLAAAAPTLSAASAYNLGVAVGWKRFAITGDVVKVDTGVLPGGRESADVALSYGGNSWRARLAAGADRAIGQIVPAAGLEEGYSLDLGGSLSVTRNLDVTAGARYRIQRDRIQPLADLRRDSQAVYLGTAFRF